MYRGFFKRMLDAGISCLLLVLLFPLLIVLFVLVRLFLGKPVLFRQQRPGLQEKPFFILKFRTMNHRRDSSGVLLSDRQRLTRFGKLLRSASLDELPALFNVLMGDMSLVGPRPLLMAYLPFYSERQKQRHTLRPGITGWAQVNGRNTLGWTERFELDVWYAEHCSFLLDLKILFLTMIRVFRREGISAPGQATMSRFDDECRKTGKLS